MKILLVLQLIFNFFINIFYPVFTINLSSAKYIVFSIIILLYSNLELFGQRKGYISAQWITKSGESVKGYIKPNVTEQNYIPAELNGAHTSKSLLSADSIDYIVYDGEIAFRSQEIIFKGNKEYTFCQLIFSGASNLYLMDHRELGKLYFIEKDEKMLMVPKSNLMQFYQVTFGECFDQSISQSYLYIESNIKKVLKHYSNCTDPNIENN